MRDVVGDVVGDVVVNVVVNVPSLPFLPYLSP
jgi:hypothetical protein